MDYGDYYWGLYRDYYRDPFPQSLLSTRQSLLIFLRGLGGLGFLQRCLLRVLLVRPPKRAFGRFWGFGLL